MTEYPHSDVPLSNVTHFGQFRSTHHPDLGEVPLPSNPELEDDGIFAARRIQLWGELSDEAPAYQTILSDISGDKRLAELISNESLQSKGATLHFAGEAFAVSMRQHGLDPGAIIALESLYRLHFIYQRNSSSRPVRHPMVAVLFQKIMSEATS